MASTERGQRRRGQISLIPSLRPLSKPDASVLRASVLNSTELVDESWWHANDINNGGFSFRRFVFVDKSSDVRWYVMAAVYQQKQFADVSVKLGDYPVLIAQLDRRDLFQMMALGEADAIRRFAVSVLVAYMTAERIEDVEAIIKSMSYEEVLK